jgi:hypothetical protein
MAPIALKQKDRCQGFSKDDHRQCRLRRSKGLTCNIHQKYFINWFVTHPSAIWVHRSKREIYEYEYVLKNHLVTIPEDHMDFLENTWINPQNYSEYLLLIAKYSDYDLLRIPRILRSEVSKFVMDITNYIYVEDLIASYNFTKFTPFLKNHKVAYEILKYIIQDLMRHYTEAYVNISIPLDFFKERFSYIIYMIPEWKSLIYSSKLRGLRDEILQERVSPAIMTLRENFFREVVDTVMKEFNNSVKFEIYYNVNKFKRDLIAEVLHPDRIEKLVREHGMEALEHV